jgi:hypothetical protein
VEGFPPDRERCSSALVRLDAFALTILPVLSPRAGVLVDSSRVPRCDVADALSKLKVPHGGFLPGITMWSPRRQEGPAKIIGPAYTVKYVRKNYENEPKPAGHYVRMVEMEMEMGREMGRRVRGRCS